MNSIGIELYSVLIIGTLYSVVIKKIYSVSVVDDGKCFFSFDFLLLYIISDCFNFFNRSLV